MGNWPNHIRRARDLARFWKNTSVEGSCIVWVGQRNKDGYGKFTTTLYPKLQTHHLAHRWLYQEVFGELPGDSVVMHTCDNPSCVTLQHLDRGTYALNNQDRHNKGRTQGTFQAGSLHPNAKLTESQVLEIKRLRQEGKTHREIASLFSLTREAIRDICNGKRWKTK